MTYPCFQLSSTRIVLAFLLSFTGLSHSATTALNIFVPPEAATRPDGNSSFTPFDAAGRFQQVYDSSAFGDLSTSGGGWLRQIIFTVDATDGHFFEAIVHNIQLNVSTTSRSPDRLSQLFGDNVGSDDTLAIGPGSLNLAGDRNSFTVLFDLPSLPFFYNPRDGNLLLDFRINQGIGSIGRPQGVAILGAFDSVGDSVSSLYASSSGNAAVGQLSSLGLSTDFVFFPIPEPSALALLSVGLGVLVVSRKWMGRGD